MEALLKYAANRSLGKLWRDRGGGGIVEEVAMEAKKKKEKVKIASEATTMSSWR